MFGMGEERALRGTELSSITTIALSELALGRVTVFKRGGHVTRVNYNYGIDDVPPD